MAEGGLVAFIYALDEINWLKDLDNTSESDALRIEDMTTSVSILIWGWASGVFALLIEIVGHKIDCNIKTLFLCLTRKINHYLDLYSWL